MSPLASIIDDAESPFEEIEDQMIAIARAAFANAPVNVEANFDDLTVLELDELRAKALRKVQVLFDFFSETPIVDEDRKSSNDSVQKDIISFGFYVAYAAVKQDEGYFVRKIAYRAINKLRKTFYRQRLSLTVRQGVKTDVPVKISSILKEDGVFGLVVFRVTFSLILPLQFR